MHRFLTARGPLLRCPGRKPAWVWLVLLLVLRDDCAAALANPLPSLAELAEARGLKTGIVNSENHSRTWLAHTSCRQS